MNDKIGNISFYDPQQETSFTKPYSEETSKLIDEEVRLLIDECYNKTLELLKEKKAEVEKLAEALLEKEVLFQSDVEVLIGKRPHEEKKQEDDPATPTSEISAGVPPYDSDITKQALPS